MNEKVRPSFGFMYAFPLTESIAPQNSTNAGHWQPRAQSVAVALVMCRKRCQGSYTYMLICSGLASYQCAHAGSSDHVMDL